MNERIAIKLDNGMTVEYHQGAIFFTHDKGDIEEGTTTCVITRSKKDFDALARFFQTLSNNIGRTL